MDYTYLEKLILLSLKERRRSVLADGANREGPVQKLWYIIGKSYYPSTVVPVEGDEIVREEILDKADCTPDDLRVALQMLREEELILCSGTGYYISTRGLRACRHFRLNEV